MILFGLVVALVVLVLVAVLTLPFTINPIVKTAASLGGPKVLGVAVSVGDVKLSPLAGSLTISQLKVGNPQGYSDKNNQAPKTILLHGFAFRQRTLTQHVNPAT